MDILSLNSLKFYRATVQNRNLTKLAEPQLENARSVPGEIYANKTSAERLGRQTPYCCLPGAAGEPLAEVSAIFREPVVCHGRARADLDRVSCVHLRMVRIF